MLKYNTFEAKTKLSQILEQVEKDQTVIICWNGVPVAEVKACNKNNRQFKINKKFSKIKFSEDPSLPLSVDDWPKLIR